MEVAVRSIAAPEIGACGNRRRDACRQALGIGMTAQELIEGRAAGLGVTDGACRRERGPGTIVVCVVPRAVRPAVVDPADDAQLVRKRAKRLHRTVEFLRLERSREPEPEEEVECTSGRFGVGGGGSRPHRVEQWQRDGHRSCSTQEGASAEALPSVHARTRLPALHGLTSV